MRHDDGLNVSAVADRESDDALDAATTAKALGGCVTEVVSVTSGDDDLIEQGKSTRAAALNDSARDQPAPEKTDDARQQRAEELLRAVVGGANLGQETFRMSNEFTARIGAKK